MPFPFVHPHISAFDKYHFMLLMAKILPIIKISLTLLEKSEDRLRSESKISQLILCFSRLALSLLEKMGGGKYLFKILNLEV